MFSHKNFNNYKIEKLDYFNIWKQNFIIIIITHKNRKIIINYSPLYKIKKEKEERIINYFFLSLIKEFKNKHENFYSTIKVLLQFEIINIIFN